MARGDRFAAGRPPRRDNAGRSLPSDRSMRYVELQVTCKHHQDGPPVILGAWWIESHYEVFDPRQVNERDNSAVIERQWRTDPDGSDYLRYKLRCPQCGNSPVLRQDKIDAALAAIYEHGAAAKVVQYRI